MSDGRTKYVAIFGDLSTGKRVVWAVLEERFSTNAEALEFARTLKPKPNKFLVGVQSYEDWLAEVKNDPPDPAPPEDNPWECKVVVGDKVYDVTPELAVMLNSDVSYEKCKEVFCRSYGITENEAVGVIRAYCLQYVDDLEYKWVLHNMRAKGYINVPQGYTAEDTLRDYAAAHQVAGSPLKRGVYSVSGGLKDGSVDPSCRMVVMRKEASRG
jgi:hypothetical protein